MTCIISFFFRRKKVPEKVGHFYHTLWIFTDFYFVDFYGFIIKHCSLLLLHKFAVLSPTHSKESGEKYCSNQKHNSPELLV
jgi:hypothetical protein